MREVAFPKEEHSNWLFGAKWSALKIYIQVTLYRLNQLDLRIYMYIHICIQKQLMKKEATNLNENREGYMEGLRRRKGKGEML